VTRQYQGIDIPSAGKFELDPAHSRVGFVARHLMVSKVRGSFGATSGTITIADDPAESSVEVSIKTDTITTGVEARDNHLRSGDFIESAKYPTIDFRSTRLEPKGGNEFLVHGELTIKGVTRSVTLDVEFEGAVLSPYGKEVVGFSASTEIDREEWGITWNQALETGGVMVGKKVKIEIEVEAYRV
jgi:polyisoprenoid-binding protein YceI